MTFEGVNSRSEAASFFKLVQLGHMTVEEARATIRPGSSPDKVNAFRETVLLLFDSFMVLGRAPRSVQIRKRKAGLGTKRRPYRGKGGPGRRPKFSPEQIQRMRDAWTAGTRLRDIAARFGISIMTLRRYGFRERGPGRKMETPKVEPTISAWTHWSNLRREGELADAG